MNRETLFKSIGQVDEQTLIKTESYRKKPRNRVVRLIAASVALVLMVFGFSYLFPKDQPAQTLSSWFVITAQAVEGDWNELDLNDGYFNSGGTNQSISLFPADVPLFKFVVEPASFDNNESIYSQFSVSVSYNNRTVDSLDDHVVVYNIIPLVGSNGAYGYEVTGWFEETTDVKVTIVDKRTGDLVEEITVNVKPQQGESVYTLTVTNVETHDIK